MVLFCAISSSFHSRKWFRFASRLWLTAFTKVVSRVLRIAINALAIFAKPLTHLKVPHTQALLAILSKEAKETFLALWFFYHTSNRGWFEVITRMNHLIDNSPIRNTTKIAVINKEVSL